MRRLVELSTPSGNGAAGPHSVQLPSGTYYNLYIARVSGTIAIGNINTIRLTLDGDAVVSCDGDNLDSRNQIYGDTAFGNANPLRIPLSLPSRFVPGGLADVPAVTIGRGSPIKQGELTWDSTGATTPVFRVLADMDDAAPRASMDGKQLLVPRIQQTVRGLINGENDIGNLNYGTEQYLYVVDVLLDGGVATDTTLLRVLYGPGAAVIHRATRDENNHLLSAAGMTILSGVNYFYTRLFPRPYRLSDLLSTRGLNMGSQDLRFRWTHNASVDADVLASYIGVL